jgi:hypothetical protein
MSARVARKTVKTQFVPAEDEQLRQQVQLNGTSSWTIIAAAFPNRDGRQLRKRWVNYLSPDMSKTAWTSEENERLMRLGLE